MIAQNLEVSMHTAFVEARQRRHEFITVEHLLMALLDNPTAAEVLRACGANMDELRKNLTKHTAEQTPCVAADREVDTQPTLGFQRVIQRAILRVQSSGRKEVTGADVLVAIFGEKDSHAVYFLKREGIARLDILNYVSHGIGKAPGADEGEMDEEAEEEGPLLAERSLQVVLYKDEETPVEFTTNVLQDFLLMDREEAEEVVRDVYRDGRAVCGLYPREAAEFIIKQVLAYARKHGHALRCETAIQK
jgi:ATP-dependent Clp protease ATP-binding subunit ClpA